jgi:hypothetical protein
LAKKELDIFLDWLFVFKLRLKGVYILVDFDNKTYVDIDTPGILLSDSSVGVEAIFAGEAFRKA